MLEKDARSECFLKMGRIFRKQKAAGKRHNFSERAFDNP
jgi:hypothetical protein